jgi:isopenicillin N synthase-like dioxygenase
MVTSHDENLPVIDLSLPVIQCAEDLRAACEDIGFFVLRNHGVDDRFRSKTFEQAAAFFALPMEKKMAVLADSNSRGYTRYQEETLDPSNQSCGDTKEGYYIGREVVEGDEEYGQPLRGPNQWPSVQDLPEWRADMERYFKEVRDLGYRLLRIIGLSLGLEEDFFLREGMFDKPMATLRLLHYPPRLSSVKDGVLGCGAHSDYGMITILATDGNTGLQVRKSDGTWLTVEANATDYVINIGDMLERWTNGRYKSTVHRVVMTQEITRYSIPFFFEPNFDCVVECLPCCVSKDRPPLFPPTTSGQHLLDKYRQTHADFKK